MALGILARKLHPLRVMRLFTFLGCTFLVFFTVLQMLQSTQNGHHIQNTVLNVKVRKTKEQIMLDYIAQNLDVYYILQSNEKNSYHADVMFTNTGSQNISTGKWAIYFHYMKHINYRIFNLNVGILTLSHVNSYLYKLKPTGSFPNLTQGMPITFSLTGKGYMIARSDVHPNWYISVDGSNRSEPRIIQSTAREDITFVAPFNDKTKWKRGPSDQCEPYSPVTRYQKNELQYVKASPTLVTPTPVKTLLNSEGKTVVVDNGWTIVYTPDLKTEAEHLNSHLKVKMSIQENVSMKGKAKEILLHIVPKVTAKTVVSTSSYELNVDPEHNTITITGSAAEGVFYGIQSLLQLPDLDNTEPPFSIPAVTISDHPRFPYRGLMIDVGRNFHTKEELFKLMDVMAVYKLNKLHIHLTDDEGWRLEIPGLPELTEIGGRRCHDLTEMTCILPMLGSGPFSNSSGSGYLTVSDYKQLLEYAKALHIAIIPEIDIPGHSHAAIHSMEARYHKYILLGDEEKASEFLLSDPKDTSVYLSGQRFKDCAINPCLESSYHFVEHVMAAIIEMHKDIMPLDIFHFGGDEVPATAYTKSPVCEKFKKTNPDLVTSKHLKIYFVKRVAEIAAKLRIGLQGWEDAFTLQRNNFMSLSGIGLPDLVSNAWFHMWGSGMEGNPYRQANTGYKVVLTSATHLYFDNPQEPDPDDWGLTWATRYIDTKRAFYYRPDSFYDNIDFNFWGSRTGKIVVCAHSSACPPLQRKNNIIGMCGALWTEEVRTESRMQQMLWPRMLAVAERAWHKAEWEELQGEELIKAKEKDWQTFANTLGQKELKRLEKMGVDFYLPPPGVKLNKNQVLTNVMFPGMRVQYNQDGDTWQDHSPELSLSGMINFATTSYDGRRRSRIVSYNIPKGS